jgi:hypothetical protein
MRVSVFAVMLVVGLFSGLAARAAPANDVVVRNLVTGAGADAQVRQQDFRLLSRELGLMFTAPAQAAETTGITGFEIGLDYTFHVVNFQAPYWQDAIATPGTRVPMTLGLRARKGFVLPLPLVSELEVGSQWLIESQMLSLGGTARIALHEGFRYIPDLAVFAGFHRLIGSGDLDLFTAVAGASISRSFGVLGTFNLCPFASYESVFVNASSSVIDTTPENTADTEGAVVFGIVGAAQNRIDRISGGLRFVMANVLLVAGVNVSLAGLEDISSNLVVQPNLRLGVSF